MMKNTHRLTDDCINSSTPHDSYWPPLCTSACAITHCVLAVKQVGDGDGAARVLDIIIAGISLSSSPVMCGTFR